MLEFVEALPQPLQVLNLARTLATIYLDSISDTYFKSFYLTEEPFQFEDQRRFVGDVGMGAAHIRDETIELELDVVDSFVRMNGECLKLGL